MNKWKTKNDLEIFQVLKNRSNSFLISLKGLNILIDTGTRIAYNKLKKNIDLLNLKSGKIDYLILTHTHFDHCQNAAKIKQENNCKIIMSEQEKKIIEVGFTPLPQGAYAFTKLVSKIGNFIGARGFGYKPFSADIFINEELSLEHYGLPIKIISTKGHSNGYYQCDSG